MPVKFVSPFQLGDLVMHATHGISRYAGTRLLQSDGGSTAEYFQLDYADGDRVFVPIEHVGRLTRHLGPSVGLARLPATVVRRTPYSRGPRPAAPPPPA